MKKLIFSLSLVFSLLSCNSTNTTNFTEFSFIPEIYPYTDTTYATHLNTTPFFSFGQEKFNKIIFYINGDCSACFAHIIEWQKFINKDMNLINKRKIKTALVIHSEELEMLEYNLEKIPNSLPIYIDTAQYFSIYNNVPLTQPSITLLDSNNMVVYRTLNTSRKQYAKEIRKVLKRLL